MGQTGQKQGSTRHQHKCRRCGRPSFLTEAYLKKKRRLDNGCYDCRGKPITDEKQDPPKKLDDWGKRMIAELLQLEPRRTGVTPHWVYFFRKPNKSL